MRSESYLVGAETVSEALKRGRNLGELLVQSGVGSTQIHSSRYGSRGCSEWCAQPQKGLQEGERRLVEEAFLS